MNDRKQQIRETARTLFQNQGYQATSMQEIADLVGISKGAVYLHFRSKEELLMAILEDVDVKLMARMTALMEDATLSGREKLRAQVLAQLDEMQENRQLNEIFLQETGLSLNERLMAFVQETRYRWQTLQEAFLVRVYGEALQPWRIDAAVIFNGIMQEYHVCQMLENTPLPRTELADFLVALMDGIASQLVREERLPILREEDMPQRLAMVDRLAEAAAPDPRAMVAEMIESLPSLALPQEEEEVLGETLSHLARALEEGEPDKVLVRAMLASLRGIPQLEEPRACVAELMNVKLV